MTNGKQITFMLLLLLFIFFLFFTRDLQEYFESLNIFIF